MIFLTSICFFFKLLDLSCQHRKSRKHLAEAEDDRLQTETVWNEESNDGTAVFITKHTMER